MASNKVYEMVTDKILAKLNQGVVPWRQPWVGGSRAVNWKTQKAYRGVNAWLLDAGEYATYKQITEAGGEVKKGAKSEFIVFWTWLEDKTNANPKAAKIPFLRYYNVFNIATQTEGIRSKIKQSEAFEHDPIREAENIISGFMGAPDLRFESGRAFYNKALDFISVPPLNDYPNKHEYYSTLFHEMVHATGHPDRLNRSTLTAFAAFGDENYSKEELVAEMGAAMLCGMAGIDNHTIENSVAYIQSWKRKIQEDCKLLVQSAAQAQKASDFILNVKFAGEETTE